MRIVCNNESSKNANRGGVESPEKVRARAMTIKKAKMIEKILKEIEKDGKAYRQSYDYELGNDGEIIKHNVFQYPVLSVYATAEEVAQVRHNMKVRTW